MLLPQHHMAPEASSAQVWEEAAHTCSGSACVGHLHAEGGGEGGLHLGETSLERRWEGSGDELGTVGVRASDPKCSVRLGGSGDTLQACTFQTCRCPST